MAKKDKEYPNPKFSSLEEEERYWEAHSPLDEGYEGEVQTSKQKRSSFLSVRLSGDELTLLRDMADEVGIAPSTYARILLMSALEQQVLMSAEQKKVGKQLLMSIKQGKLDTGTALRHRHLGNPNATEYLYKSIPKRKNEIIPQQVGVLPPREMEFNRIFGQEVLYKLLQLCELYGFRILTKEDAEREELGQIRKTHV